MKRIGNFLPKIQAANEDLLNNTDTKETMQIDVDMVKEGEEDGDENTKEEADNGENEGQTIQLEFQIGDVEKNQAVFDLLGKDDETKPAAADDDDEPVELSATEGAVAKLLQPEGAAKKNDTTKKRKVLIEEMS